MIFVVKINNFKEIKNRSDLPWIYFGSSSNLKKTDDILLAQNRRYIAKDIENITDLVRDNFVDYIGLLSELQEDKVLWYSSRMASKSMSQTSMFEQYVRIKLLETLANKQEDVLVITDDEDFFQSIGRCDLDNILVSGKNNFVKSIFVEVVKGRLKSLLYFSGWIVSKFLQRPRLKDLEAYIFSWVDGRTFKKESVFNDPYLGDLSIFLNNKGYNTARIIPVDVGTSCLIRLAQNFRNIVYPLSYISFSEFVRCFTIKFVFNKAGFSKNRDKIVDIEVLHVLADNEALKENRGKNFISNLLFYFSLRNISNIVEENSSIFYPFENQPWEKILNMASKSVKRIAYQHTAIPYNWLDYRVSGYEVNVPLPDVILTSGNVWSKFLAKYYDKEMLDEAGAIRFSYLLDLDRNKVSERVGKIVVALPIDYSTAIVLQEKLAAYLKENTLSDYQILIKTHPRLKQSVCLRDVFKKYNNCRFVSTDIKELIKDCDVLITSNSTVAFEAVTSGVATLCFQPEKVSFGLEHFIKEYVFVAFEENFSEKMKEVLERSSNNPSINIEEFFSLPNYDLFVKHMPSTNKG